VAKIEIWWKTAVFVFYKMRVIIHVKVKCTYFSVPFMIFV